MSAFALVLCLLVLSPLVLGGGHKKYGNGKGKEYDNHGGDYRDNKYHGNDYKKNGHGDYKNGHGDYKNGDYGYGLPGRYKNQKQWKNGVGLLELFEGTWEGHGFTMISLPNYDHKYPSTGPSNYRVKVDSTWERLTFSRVNSPVPNRGSVERKDKYKRGQPDINLGGLQYQQYITDKETGEELHVEPGFFLRVPKTRMPKMNETYVRLGTIPHGDSILAQSTFATFAEGGPRIDDVNSRPNIGAYGSKDFLKPFYKACLPQGFGMDALFNPNLVLLDDIKNQNIVGTVVIAFSSTPDGGVLNIPHVQRNANASSIESIFWVEIVEDRHGKFLQLQYTQTVMLDIVGHSFPHISVATLRRMDDYDNDY